MSSSRPPETLEQQWYARGLAQSLLTRARALGIPDGQLERLLFWNPTRERMEEEVDWADKLQNGRMRFRQLTMADDTAFRELWANAPESIGEWDVTVERGPDAFAQFELQERPVLNGLFDGATMVACVSFSLRRTVIGQQDVVVRYGQAMRVHKDHRGQQYAHWVRSLPWAIGLGRPTHLQYDFIRSGNMTMEGWNRKFMPTVDTVPVRDGEVPGIPVTVLQYPGRPLAGGRGSVRQARVTDLERCVALINRTHEGRDLFRPYTVPSLMDRLDAGLADGLRPRARPPYSLEDFYVLEQGGQIAACAGLWDRGRDLRERWRRRGTTDERVVAVTAVLDHGFSEGRADGLALLIEHLIGITHELGRDYLVAPLETLAEVAVLLQPHKPVPETRYLQWRAETPAINPPPFLDLIYW